MRLNSLTVLLLVNLLFGLLWSVNAKSTSDSAEEDDDASKQLRRSEISKALGLLKKHSIIGKNAKIILKASGKHLLVDPSERLQVIASHTSTSDLHKSAATTNKVAKLQESKAKSKGTSSKKSTTKKRSSKDKSLKPKKPTSLTPSNIGTITLSSTLPLPLSLIQKNIMENASSKSARIVDSLMGTKMLNEISSRVTAIIHNHRAESLSQLSDLITETLDDTFGGHWHTISIAMATPQPAGLSSNQVIAGSSKESLGDEIHSLMHVAVDDHSKTATFFVTLEFGTLRIYIFK